MARKLDPIPDDMTIAEASEFWDQHSVTDYPSQAVEVSWEPDRVTAFVPVARELLGKIERQAKAKGLSASMLIDLWLREKVPA
ncbi:MAG: hypothetical protein HC897_06330 [Thermoanaerobaculia bacterium]|nr:hypothetical protein [Thermoanaerobaculia bacterium]